jgi:hypothetical protein
MPEYFFTVYAREKGAQAEQAATLSDDIAAFTCACEMARELARSKDTTDPDLRINVRDENRPMVFSIPLLAASA